MTVLKNLALESQGRICEPCSENQGDDDLRDKAHDPHDHCILKISKEMLLAEKLCIVS